MHPPDHAVFTRIFLLNSYYVSGTVVDAQDKTDTNSPQRVTINDTLNF